MIDFMPWHARRAVAACNSHTASELAGPYVIAAMRYHDKIFHSNFLETFDVAIA